MTTQTTNCPTCGVPDPASPDPCFYCWEKDQVQKHPFQKAVENAKNSDDLDEVGEEYDTLNEENDPGGSLRRLYARKSALLMCKAGYVKPADLACEGCGGRTEYAEGRIPDLHELWLCQGCKHDLETNAIKQAEPCPNCGEPGDDGWLCSSCQTEAVQPD